MRRAVGIGLLVVAALALALGIWYDRDVLERGIGLARALYGLALALGVAAAVVLAPRKGALLVAGAYAGALVGAIVSRVMMGFAPEASNVVLWTLVMLVAGPVLAFGEAPLVVLLGAALGLGVALVLARRS